MIPILIIMICSTSPQHPLCQAAGGPCAVLGQDSPQCQDSRIPMHRRREVGVAEIEYLNITSKGCLWQGDETPEYCGYRLQMQDHNTIRMYREHIRRESHGTLHPLSH